MNGLAPETDLRFATEYPNATQVVDKVYYDSNDVLNAQAATLNYFTAIQAAITNGNMETAGQLPAPKHFRIYSIHAFVRLGNDVSDIQALAHAGVARLLISDKPYGEWPLWVLPSGGGLWGWVATGNPATTFEFGGIGLPHTKNRYALSQPLTLFPQRAFRVEVSWPIAPVLVATHSLVIALKGIEFRQVQ